MIVHNISLTYIKSVVIPRFMIFVVYICFFSPSLPSFLPLSQSLQYAFTININPFKNIVYHFTVLKILHNNKIFLIASFHPLYVCCHSFHLLMSMLTYIYTQPYVTECTIIILNKLLSVGLAKDSKNRIFVLLSCISF